MGYRSDVAAKRLHFKIFVALCAFNGSSCLTAGGFRCKSLSSPTVRIIIAVISVKSKNRLCRARGGCGSFWICTACGGFRRSTIRELFTFWRVAFHALRASEHSIRAQNTEIDDCLYSMSLCHLSILSKPLRCLSVRRFPAALGRDGEQGKSLS